MDPRAVRRAFVFSEVFGRPLSLRQSTSHAPLSEPGS
jgi:hypothetical protein